MENISNKSFVLVDLRIFGFENSLFLNALKVCVNEIGNIQEKDEKSLVQLWEQKNLVH